MKIRSTASVGLSLLAVLAVFVAAPAGAAAQSDLDASQAQAFLGEWVMSLDTDLGPMTFEIQIQDMMGKVGAHMGSAELGGMQEITNITREGESLHLAYDLDMQGQVIDVAMTLSPDGDNLSAMIEAAAGSFVATAVATPAG